MNIAALLHDQAIAHGSRTAIIERDRTVTFDELDRGAAAAAADLAAAGIRPGMRALVFVPMSIGLYTTMIGMFRLRATAVFVDPSAGRERLAQCITRTRPEALIAVPRAHLLRLSSRAIRRLPLKISVGGWVPFAAGIGARLAPHAGPVEPCDPDTPAIITFTSGSTGEPKAALRTHGFLVAQHEALVDALALAPGDVDLTTLPIFLLANLASGVTSVIPDADLRAPGAIDPGPVLSQVRAARATRTVASPALMLRLAGHPGAAGALGTLRRVFTGGAPVFPATLDAIAAAAPAAVVTAVYGSTEAEPIAEIERGDVSAQDRVAMREGAGLLTGRPTPSIEVRILPDRWGTPAGPWTRAQFEREALAPGSVGEIVVIGAHVLAGYLDGRGDEETKITVDARVWHRTGDAGYFDMRGRLWLLGRCAARVQDEHGTLYPFAVECAASDIPGLERTAFVQREGRRWLVAQLVAPPVAGKDSVLSEIRARLAWARLDDILVVARIPVDARHNAKVDYAALETLIANR
ncbi:MAG: AMP-binding protein [Acidobacteria bacterium]|nr:AMP-binding protein [Acidobacteriota bacterium]